MKNRVTCYLGYLLLLCILSTSSYAQSSPIQFNVLANGGDTSAIVVDVIAPDFGTIYWAANGDVIYIDDSNRPRHLPVTIPCLIQDGQGNETTKIYSFFVPNEEILPLTIRHNIDCSNSSSTEIYTASVLVEGGQAPYLVTNGVFSATLEANGMVTFPIPIGSNYYVTIIDNLGAVREINGHGCYPRL